MNKNFMFFQYLIKNKLKRIIYIFYRKKQNTFYITVFFIFRTNFIALLLLFSSLTIISLSESLFYTIFKSKIEKYIKKNFPVLSF
jgi:hypothetical protein